MYSQTGRKWSPVLTLDPDQPDNFTATETGDALDEGYEEGDVDHTAPPLTVPRPANTGNT